MAGRARPSGAVTSPTAGVARHVPPPPIARQAGAGAKPAPPRPSVPNAGLFVVQAKPPRAVPPPPTAFGPQASGSGSRGGTAQRKVAGAAAAPNASLFSAQARPVRTVAPPPTAFGPRSSGAASHGGTAQRKAAGMAPPPTAFGGPATVLQRRPGPPAPPPAGFAGRGPGAAAPRYAGAVVQCDLQITDQNRYFKKKTAAKNYLEEKYREVLRSMTYSGQQVRDLTSTEWNRLNEVAAVARDERYLYPIGTLKEVMDYIATGQPINIQRYDSRPELTPQRVTDDDETWNFVLYENYKPPKKMEVPQSPTHETYFPSETSYTPHYVDLLGDLSGVRDDIHDWKKGSVKSHLGKNQYAYRVKIHFRLDELDTLSSQGNSFFAPQQYGTQQTETWSSPNYTSKKMFPPQEKGERPINQETEIRDVLSHLHTNYDRDEFSNVSMFTGTKTPQYYQTARIGQLASLYFHSEVQAASDESGADQIAQNAVDGMVAGALGQKGQGHYNLVVVAIIIEGYSDCRTVCGGACKPALTYLGERISETAVKHLHKLRDSSKVQKAKLHIRRSSEFRASVHVGAHTTFQGLRTGAQVETGKPGVLPHHTVSEYSTW